MDAHTIAVWRRQIVGSPSGLWRRALIWRSGLTSQPSSHPAPTTTSKWLMSMRTIRWSRPPIVASPRRTAGPGPRVASPRLPGRGTRRSPRSRISPALVNIQVVHILLVEQYCKGKTNTHSHADAHADAHAHAYTRRRTRIHTHALTHAHTYVHTRTAHRRSHAQGRSAPGMSR